MAENENIICNLFNILDEYYINETENIIDEIFASNYNPADYFENEL